jgi:hypothetical protein
MREGEIHPAHVGGRGSRLLSFLVIRPHGQSCPFALHAPSGYAFNFNLDFNRDRRWRKARAWFEYPNNIRGWFVYAKRSGLSDPHIVLLGERSSSRLGRSLATRLRADEVALRLDPWRAALGDQLPLFMQPSIRENGLF